MESVVFFYTLLFVLACVAAKPTIYVKNENDKLEPVLVAVSSTVIPLPVYKVGYGVAVQGSKLPKPAGEHKLITETRPQISESYEAVLDSEYQFTSSSVKTSKKKGIGKTTEPTPIKIIQHKDGIKKQKDVL